MRSSYDLSADAAYFEFAGRDGGVARTVDIDGSTMVDLDADGNLLGIEVLSPGRAWPLARILREYELSDEDATALMQAYGLPRSVGVAKR